jgi:hypothetical protein
VKLPESSVARGPSSLGAVELYRDVGPTGASPTSEPPPLSLLRLFPLRIFDSFLVRVDESVLLLRPESAIEVTRSMARSADVVPSGVPLLPMDAVSEPIFLRPLRLNALEKPVRVHVVSPDEIPSAMTVGVAGPSLRCV